MKASYRLYCLDGRGEIALADWLQADSDEDAVTQARQLKGGTLKCEIWLKDRLVRRLGAEELSIRAGMLSPGSELRRGCALFQ